MILNEILKKSVLVALFFVFINIGQAQTQKWFDPLQSAAVQGRLSTLSDEHNFARLSSKLKDQVRPPVWGLGQNAAGLYVDFKTSADTITVKYRVKGALHMPHMPTTGVSGVDLYYQDKELGKWSWSWGRYQFKDTIEYTFSNIGANKGGVYRLYLPLYNSLEWLEIGVTKDHSFEFVNQKSEPIVVYGTSIAQGACASRPGLAWTNILGRNFDQQVINLGFSGNGRLEQPILDVINEENASVFILDCIPNLSITKDRSAEQLDDLVYAAVKFLRKNHKTLPIILTAHSSAFTPGMMNIATLDEYNNSTIVAKKTFERLREEGDQNIYWLDNKEIGLDINSTVDYAHPNDIGMMKIAEAYTQLIKSILSK